MKLLVIYLYFAEPKGSGPATMRILSYIDFHNQLYDHGQKWPTRMIQITSDYQFQDIFFMSDQTIHNILLIIAYVYIEVTYP